MTEIVASSQVKIIRESILGFLKLMNKEKRHMEQQIRERSEAIKSQFFSQGATQFSYAQVNDLGSHYKDEYLHFYQNSIHMNLLANSATFIRKAIEYGFINSGIVQEEWLSAFNSMQDQLNSYETMANQLDDTEKSLVDQTDKISQLEVGAQLSKTDLAHFENLIAEKDQTIKENDQEILNLSEGLSRMESQANNMGQNMLQNSMTIEELQGVIGEKDIEINELHNKLQSTEANASDIDSLREQNQSSQMKISDLESKLSSSSSNLVDQMQNNLTEAREDLLKTRKELVDKNDEIYQIKLKNDETDTSFKRQKEILETLETNYNQLKSERDTRESEISEIKIKNEDLESTLHTSDTELKELTVKQETINTALEQSKEQLAQFEGKAAVSQEEQNQINRQVSEMNAQLAKANSTLDYFKKILVKDVKFKTLLFLDSIGEEVRLDNLAKGIVFSQETVQRAIIELAEDGFATTRKEGRFIYVSKGAHESPFSLAAAFA
ncbi:MAG: Chromosome partition protein Smc [Candidatus Heimdallarchaeota archaeon LC_2]|nr:MAG: Chromosome partition protein Smc [Candidatus Heimdallarchaeota archaeon LC_2]